MKNQIDFIKSVAKDQNITLDNKGARRCYNVLTKEWGVRPSHQDWYYKVKEYFVG